MRKPYRLPGWTKNSSYYSAPRSGIELTTSRLHNFIVAEVSHAFNHSATEAVASAEEVNLELEERRHSDRGYLHPTTYIEVIGPRGAGMLNMAGAHDSIGEDVIELRQLGASPSNISLAATNVTLHRYLLNESLLTLDTT